ncbi:MAG: peptidoglycan DD-metalloendopeptidase family protein [Burkholderiales bacterium]
MTVGRRLGLSLAVVAVALALVACTARRPAPVEDRERAPQAAKPAPVTPGIPAAVQPETYVVKRGDTLYSIALDNGADWRELASWNDITDPSRLAVGQVLRIRLPLQAASPDGVVVSPVQQATPIAGRPLGAEGPAPAPPAAAPTAGGLKSEPKGLRLPYSEENLAAVQRADGARVAAAPKPEAPPPVATVKPEPPPAAAKPEPPPVAAKPENDGGEEVDWMWPATGKVVATFNGASSKGVDIAGRLGDPVYASAPGKVVYSGEGIPAYGKLVIIRHNGTYLSAYAHNSQILVKEGQTVTKGQKIAEVGSSGSESPKLHFEIRRLGKPVDPLQYLPSR